jgi:hypothetical protein
MPLILILYSLGIWATKRLYSASIATVSKALIIGASSLRRVSVSPEWAEVSSNWVLLLVSRLIIGGLEGCAWKESIFVVIAVLY